MPLMRGRKASRLVWLVALAIGFLATGCGKQYVVFHPQGPVATSELHLIVTTSVIMGAVILLVFLLFAIVVVRFRDTPGNKAPYVPEWAGNKKLEIIWFVIPVLIVIFIAIPTVQKTYALDRLPPAKNPLVVDVTSLNWKWLFQYPGQHMATVNYLEVPVGRPVLYELTADSPMNTFWVPQLGGMEYTMPGRVLPLWLQANKPGVYWGRSANFSGPGFAHMIFHVKAVPAAQFATWVKHVQTTAPKMTLATYRQLLKFNNVGTSTYSGYPAHTFPSKSHGFTLKGGMYMESKVVHVH